MEELSLARAEINRIDAEMARLFEERMKAVEQIAQYKKDRGLPVRDPAREAEMIDRRGKEISDPALLSYYVTFLKNTIDVSCRYQTNLLSGTKIPVNIHNGSYDIILEPGALSRVGSYLNLDRKVLIVTDSGVPSAYADCVERAARNAVRVVLPQGEASKTMEQLQYLLRRMLEADFSRGDCVCAVGGGVVGDLAGFASACYMRGIEFYNIPTTLLAQLDSSIGGKTAVDFEGVKNVVGAFRQPGAVLIDPDVLSTLDARQLHAGLAEAVKMAATSDEALFSMLECCEHPEKELPEIIRRSLLIKKQVVEQDPEEAGLRKVLNFGHTVGHAVEALHGGELLHGECVGLGMLPMSAPPVRERIREILRKLDLPTEIHDRAEDLLPYLVHDKKKAADGITTVQVDAIGTYAFRKMTAEEILDRLEMAR